MPISEPAARADERAALRRVAGLLTATTALETICATGMQEMGSCVGARTASVYRCDTSEVPVLVSSWSMESSSAFPVRLHDELRSVHRTGRPARDSTGTWVMVPIVLAGQVWGVTVAVTASTSSSVQSFPADTEARMAGFADLLAAAVAHDQARINLFQLAEEQAILRRLAVLVARGASRDDVLNTIAAEAFGLFDVEFTALLRYDQTGAAFIVARHNAPPDLDMGERAPDVPDGLVSQVFRSGRPARVEAYKDLTGPGVGRMHGLGITAGAAAPILVDGSLWGVIAAMQRSGSVAAGLEHRLADFADIAATAVSAAQAKDDLHGLADQQAALRRVAELAARDAPTEDVLAAVAAHASQLAGVEFTTVLRFEPDGSTEISALSGAPDGLVIGMRASGAGEGAVQRVWRTGRAARADRLAAMTGHWPQVAHGFGFSSSAAVPISIQGGLWGALVVVARDEPLAAEIEKSLTSFAEIAGTAISAAQARAALRMLVDEQAALRRVAELVARGAALQEVFRAVAVEASTLLGRAVRVEDVADTPLLGTTSPGTARSRRVGAGVAVPVAIEGRIWGALTTSTDGPALPAGTEERLAPFADLTAAAIANAEHKAQLTASRARVVATADETRRRLQRDVHDGAQQRLVQTIITLKLARDTVAKSGSAANLIGEALYHAERASTELRDLVHGILPVSLSSGGLRIGLESMIADLAIPVRLQLTAPRLPRDIETTAYFFVAEALTNVAKHANATRADVMVGIDDHALILEVRDDGAGGADPRHGTGLIGLSDRIEATNGTLTISSTTSGTTLLARVPLAQD